MSLETGSWVLDGFAGEPIRGVTEAPAGPGSPGVVVVLAHGFTAHMDFGFLPALSGLLVERCRARVVRFTFSHAGVTGSHGIRVDRPDLFERDSWGTQAVDLGIVFDAVREGVPAGVPVVLAGHSRGGGVCLLLAGRRFRDGTGPMPDGVIAIQAPDRPGSLSDADCQRLVRDGFMEMTAPLTGQVLRLGEGFGRERLERPEDFDVLTLCGLIGCPVLAVGGGKDRLVPAVCAKRIARACAHGEAVIVEGADHMFNMREPADFSATASSSVSSLASSIEGYVQRLGA